MDDPHKDVTGSSEGYVQDLRYKYSHHNTTFERTPTRVFLLAISFPLVCDFRMVSIDYFFSLFQNLAHVWKQS
jgi:hypothetical protein